MDTSALLASCGGITKRRLHFYPRNSIKGKKSVFFLFYINLYYDNDHGTSFFSIEWHFK